MVCPRLSVNSTWLHVHLIVRLDGKAPHMPQISARMQCGGLAWSEGLDSGR